MIRTDKPTIVVIFSHVEMLYKISACDKEEKKRSVRQHEKVRKYLGNKKELRVCICYKTHRGITWCHRVKCTSQYGQFDRFVPINVKLKVVRKRFNDGCDVILHRETSNHPGNQYIKRVRLV